METVPWGTLEAKAHSAGMKEVLYSLKGRVGAAVGQQDFETKRGRGLFLETDAPLAYFCVGRSPVRFRMIVVEEPRIEGRR